MRGLVLSVILLYLSGAAVCAEEERSVQAGNQPIQLFVENSMNVAIQIQWVDFEGVPQNYGGIPEGQTVSFETFPGHHWYFLREGKKIGSYRATIENQQLFTISPNALRPAGVGKAGKAKGKSQEGRSPLLGQFRVPKGKGKAQKSAGKKGAPDKTRQNAGEVEGASKVLGAADEITGSEMTPAEANQLIQYHNQVRSEVGVDNVIWSQEIASYAQEWADYLAETGKLEHRPSGGNKYGENLAAGSDPRYSALEGAQEWYAEKKLYRKGAPSSPKTAQYTQMVWKDSSRIGAGRAVCTRGKYKGWTIVVCNYSPAGNIAGQAPY